MGNERPEIRNTEFIFQTITVVSLNKYLLWNVKGSELTLVFHCHYVLIVWSAQRFCLFRIWLQFVVTTNEDEFGVVWFSGLFSNFNELRCMTLMWLCDPANTSRQRTENKMVWAFFLPLWAYRSSCCMTWTSKRTYSFLPFWKILRVCCFSIHFINSSYRNHWQLGKLEDFPLISCLCIFASGPSSSCSCLPITHFSIYTQPEVQISSLSRGTLWLTE